MSFISDEYWLTNFERDKFDWIINGVNSQNIVCDAEGDEKAFNNCNTKRNYSGAGIEYDFRWHYAEKRQSTCFSQFFNPLPKASPTIS